ncbi:leucine-rich repeat domain-containing protein, partial [Salmonella enterica]
VGLQTLSVAGNQLTSLPPLPAGLQMLSVAGNQLTRLTP